MEKYILMLTLFALGCQSREYFYQKPIAPFYPEDGSGQPQYVKTSHRMIIPGTHGRSYEVSMSPARQVFEMHLERLQNYGQPNQVYSQQLSEYLQGSGGQSAGNAGASTQTQVQQTAGNVVNYGQYQGNPQSSGSYVAQQTATQAGYAQTHNQQNGGYAGATNSQQHSGDYAAQSAAYAQSHSQGHAQQNAGSYTQGQQSAGNLAPNAQSYYNQNTGAANRGTSSQYQYPQANGQPISRQIRKCYPNGNCEYITDDRQHQQVLQQARSSFVPAPPKCNRPANLQSQRHTSTPTAATGNGNGNGNGLRDRRLFPYSEVPISHYPNKK